MSTRARRLRRLYFQGFVPLAMRFLLLGLCLWFTAAICGSMDAAGRLADALRRAQGLTTAVVNWELGTLNQGMTITPAKFLLSMELPMGGADETVPDETPAPPPEPADSEPLPEPHNEEPGLSHTEPADDLPPLSDATPTPPESADSPVEVTLKAGSGSNFLKSGSVVIRNETTINIDMDKVMSRKLAFTLERGKPQILIIHTHANEAYWTYEQDGVTVVDMGARLTELLRAGGFEVIHDTTQYDRPDFNKSYSSALAGIEKTLKENPGIQMVLDIHRDAIQSANDVVRKPVTTVDGQKTAQMMFVVGTNNSGLPHDNWPQNLCLAVQLQKRLAEGAPDLMRPINLRRERFNQHATYGSLILEVGSYGNDSAEAFRAIDLFAQKAIPLFEELLK